MKTRSLHRLFSNWKQVLLYATVLTAGAGLVWAASGTSARMMFQRAVDSPGLGPNGSVELKKNGTKQTFRVNVKDLAGESYGLFLGFSNHSETNIVCDTNNLVCTTNLITFEITCTTNCVTNEVKVSVGLIGALEGFIDNEWVAAYEANDGFAPALLQGCFTDGMTTNCFTDLDDLSGMFLFIATPASSNTVNAVLVAEVPPLSANNAVFNFKGKANLVPTTAPADPPPNPDAKGTIITKFTATQGRSFLDIRAQKLFGSQVYTLFLSSVAGGPVDSEIAVLTMVSPTSGFFRRDTKLGETLPLSASTVTNLSGFNVEIRDAFGDVHLEGTIP